MLLNKEKWHLPFESFPLLHYSNGRTDKIAAVFFFLFFLSISFSFFFLLLCDLLKTWGRASKEVVAQNRNSTDLVLPAIGIREHANSYATKMLCGSSTKVHLVVHKSEFMDILFLDHFPTSSFIFMLESQI